MQTRNDDRGEAALEGCGRNTRVRRMYEPILNLEVDEMGANATQAQATMLFLIAFVFFSCGLAADISYLYILLGLLSLGASIALFLKCKPWEHKEH